MTDRSQRTALIAVVNGQVYEDYATALFDSARRYFKPTPEVETLMLPGREGWPAGTMMRYHVVLEHWAAIKQRYGYVFLCDADMLCESLVGPEILPPYAGVTATLHPGYVGKHHSEFPYERRDYSACYVNSEDGDVYYAGGFVGGESLGFHLLAEEIVRKIDYDMMEYGITPIYHDESALNSCLAARYGPDIALDPSYCHPDDDSYYKTFWPEPYPRRLVALDKAAHERVGR